jgi:hypothetical protein
VERLDDLSPEQRSSVVLHALGEGGVAERLYRAAILLAQASFYGGIYGGGCKYLHVPGPNRGFANEVLYHRNATDYLAPERTRDGNLI